jgi:hypothetical protein
MLRGVNSPLPPLEACSRLFKQHCFPVKGSVAELAELHRLAKNFDVGGRWSAWATQRLDKMIAAARSENDDAFFRRYAQAIKMVASGKERHQSLPAMIVVAWMDFIEEHGRAPSREEVKTKLCLGWCTPRHVQRVFQVTAELFEAS